MQHREDSSVNNQADINNLLFKNNPQPMFFYNIDTLRITDANEAALDLYNYSYEEFVNLSVLDIRPEEDRERFLNHIKSPIKRTNAGIWRHCRKKGEIIFVKIISHIFQYRGETWKHVMVTDITEMKKTQDALIASEEKFRSLFHNHSAIKILLSNNGKIVDINEAGVKFYGWPREDLLKMNISYLNVLPPEELEIQLDNVRESKSHHFFFKHRRKNAPITDVEVFSSTITIGGDLFFHSIVIDISDKAKAERELLEAKRKAEESDRLKTAFLANMSHEIRTPMNGILGFMDLLQSPDLTGDERDEYIEFVRISGQRLMDTINDIIDISRIESGASIVNETTVDINNVLISQLNLFKPEADKKGLGLIIESLLPYDRRFVKTDGNKLEAILSNLIKNALKFTTTGDVTFGVQLQGRYMFFRVIDTGKGIPAHSIDSVFDRFVQADYDHSRNHEGSGLGLSISKAYVEMLGGQISVESKLGKGSTFSFTVPYTIDRIAKNTIGSNNNINLGIPSMKILVAEDDDINYQFMWFSLQSLNIEIVRALDGLEAVNMVTNNSEISLIFMDIKMPNMDGYEATRKIKEIQPGIPVIALTAYALSDDREKSLEAGCDDYLSKPVKKEKLMEMIQKYSNDE
jgi:PAS domain S-box-containing protein